MRKKAEVSEEDFPSLHIRDRNISAPIYGGN